MPKRTPPWFGTIEIEITEFRDDPPNDAAFGIYADVKGAGSRVETVRVYFDEDLFPGYFRVRWNKKLPDEERKILHEKRDLMIRWALVKIEDYLKGKIQEETVFISYARDSAWLEKVEKSKISPQSRPEGPNRFIFDA